MAKTTLVLSNRLDFTKDGGRISAVSLFVTLDASVTISMCKKEADNLHPVGNIPLADSVLQRVGNHLSIVVFTIYMYVKILLNCRVFGLRFGLWFGLWFVQLQISTLAKPQS